MQKAKMPSLVSILILTLITVVVWVSLDVYRLFNQPVSPVVEESIIAPITPTLDQDALNQIESRIDIQDSQLPDNVTNASSNTIQPSKNIETPTPESTPSATQQP